MEAGGGRSAARSEVHVQAVSDDLDVGMLLEYAAYIVPELRCAAMYKDAPRGLTRLPSQVLHVAAQLSQVVDSWSGLLALDNYGGASTVNQKHVET